MRSAKTGHHPKDGVPGLNVREMAATYVRRYGRDAALIAWGTADGYALEGDEQNRGAWLKVMDAIEKLEAQDAKYSDAPDTDSHRPRNN